MGKTWNIKGRRTVGGVMTEVTLATVHDPEYHGEWMEPDYLTAKVVSDAPIDFAFGDWIYYRGAKFTLATDPNVLKKARKNTYGEGFTYDNIKFWGRSYSLKHTGFHDIVLQDNGLPYTDLSKFSFYASSIEDVADRLQANLNRNPPDNNPWYVLTPNKPRTLQRNGGATLAWETYYASLSGDTDYTEGSATLGEKDVNMTIDDNSCLDVLKRSYTDFALSFYVKGQYVIIGGDALMPDTIFRYGKGLGLYEIERTGDENQEVVTRAYGYGSTQNLPYNYYANKFVTVFATVLSTGGGSYVHLDLPYSSKLFTNKRSDGDNSWYVTVRNETRSTGDMEVVVLPWTNEDAGDALYCQIIPEEGGAGLSGYDTDDRIVFKAGINIDNFPADHKQTTPGYPASLSIQNLMLPGFPETSLNTWLGNCATDPSQDRTQWGGLSRTDAQALLNRYTFSTDAMKPYVQSKNAGTSIGIREGSVYFDGSSQKEIMPTIDNTNYNKFLSVQQIADNGILDPNMTDSQAGAWKQFTGTVADGGIEWSYQGDTVKISMRTGYCTGREFEVKKAEKNEEGGYWTLTMERDEDQSLGRWFPYSHYSDVSQHLYQIASAQNWGASNPDTFVVTGVPLPDSYVIAASVKLLIATCGWLDRRDHMRYTYTPKIDELYMQRQDDAASTSSDEDSMHYTLYAGMKLQFEDAADLGIERYGSAALYIDVLTIKENGNEGIPTYDVVLREEKEKGTLEQIKDSIASLTAEPPVQVVERPTRTLQYVEYLSWSATGKYYHEAINPDTDVLEQSYVWHKGKKWMCLRSLTTEEPGLGCADWEPVEGDQTFEIRFYDAETNGYVYGDSVLVRRGHVNVPLWPVVLWGTDDVTSTVSSWQWQRETRQGGQISWATTRSITVTDESLPPAWSATNPAIFTCTATIAGIDITNIVTV